MTTPKAAPAVLIFAFLLLPAAARAANGAEAALYERALMQRADARCRLFTPDIAEALAAATAQARGAALRGGDDAGAVAATFRRASAKADATPCGGQDLKTAADRVRKAFDGYSALRTMNFPGVVAAWSADRKPWALVADHKVVPGPRWRLWQTAPGTGGALTVGLAGPPASGGELLAVTTAPDAGRAYAARLVLRDSTKAAQPFIDPRQKGLSGRMPPVSAARAFLARALGPAPQSLSPPGAKAGVMATFPPEAARALAALDPREAVSVEFLFPSPAGERVEAAAVEVGDFAAGQAFLAAGR